MVLHLEHMLFQLFLKKHLEYVHVVKGLGGSEALRRYLCSAVDAAGDGSMSEDMANLQHCS